MLLAPGVMTGIVGRAFNTRPVSIDGGEIPSLRHEWTLRSYAKVTFTK
jgi:hypothetical protein